MYVTVMFSHFIVPKEKERKRKENRYKWGGGKQRGGREGKEIFKSSYGCI